MFNKLKRNCVKWRTVGGTGIHDEFLSEFMALRISFIFDN